MYTQTYLFLLITHLYNIKNNFECHINPIIIGAYNLFIIHNNNITYIIYLRRYENKIERDIIFASKTK